MRYDYLIVGAGLFGATVARVLANNGRRILVIDKRNHIAGNCYDEEIDGILVNRYGGHIFHTNDDMIWRFVNRFAEFQQYEHRVKAKVGDVIYSFPPNLMTLQQMGLYELNKEAQEKIRDMFIRGYSEKQWGRKLADIPLRYVRRIEVRNTFDDRYFTDKYQGLPVGGYSKMVGQMLFNIPLELGVDYLDDRDYWDLSFDKLIYTGEIDKYYDYELGRLEYRSLHFEYDKLDLEDYQGCPAVNYPDPEVSYTRIVEWKHFRGDVSPNTIIMTEYPQEHTADNEPYYPIGDPANLMIYKEYANKADRDERVIFGGRLGEYRYLNMDRVIGSGLRLAERLLNGS